MSDYKTLDYESIFHFFITSILKLDFKEGRRFGQPSRKEFGISDGKKGVQWNLGINSETGDIKLGVNLYHL